MFPQNWAQYFYFSLQTLYFSLTATISCEFPTMIYLHFIINLLISIESLSLHCMIYFNFRFNHISIHNNRNTLQLNLRYVVVFEYLNDSLI
jgi:hypothetical protein